MRRNKVGRLSAASITPRRPFDDPSKVMPPILSRFFSSEEEKGRLPMLLSLSMRLGHSSHLFKIHLFTLNQKREVVHGLLCSLSAFCLAVSCDFDRCKLLMVVVTVIVLH